MDILGAQLGASIATGGKAPPTPKLDAPLIETCLGSGHRKLCTEQTLQTLCRDDRALGDYLGSLETQASQMRQAMELQRRMLSGRGHASGTYFCTHLAKIVGASSATLSVVLHKSLDMVPVFSSAPAELKRTKSAPDSLVDEQPGEALEATEDDYDMEELLHLAPHSIA